MSLTKAEWQLMKEKIESIRKTNPEQAEILQIALDKMGLSEKTRAKREKIVNTLEPYKLVITTTCTTCGMKREDWFQMIVNDSNTGLINMRLMERPVNARKENRRTILCLSCRSYLMSLEKSTVVSMLIDKLAGGAV